MDIFEMLFDPKANVARQLEELKGKQLPPISFDDIFPLMKNNERQSTNR